MRRHPTSQSARCQHLVACFVSIKLSHHVRPLSILRAVALSRTFDNQITTTAFGQCSLTIPLTTTAVDLTTAQKWNKTHSLTLAVTLTITISTAFALTYLLPTSISHALTLPLDLTPTTQRQNCH